MTVASATPQPSRPKSTSQLIDLSIVVPCLNEEGNVIDTIKTIIAAVKQVGCSYEIIVIDDASRDRTTAVVEEFQANHPDLPIRLQKNLVNRGYGGSYFDGAYLGQGKYYALVCGDNVFPQESLVAIFSKMGTVDIVVPVVDAENRNPIRKLLSSAFTQLVNLISGYSLGYYNGCSLYLRESVIQWDSKTYGFGFQAELLTSMLNAGATYTEVHIRTRERQSGSSKAITWKNFRSTTISLLRILRGRIRKELGQLGIGSRK